MNCKIVQRLLSPYIDRELSGTEMLELRAHLRECEPCACEEMDLRNLKGLLSLMPSVEPPVELEARLLAGVSGERREKTTISGFALVAGVSIAATIAAGLLFRPTYHDSRSPDLTPAKRDVAFEIDRDQVFAAGSDPLSGGHVVLASQSYGR